MKMKTKHPKQSPSSGRGPHASGKLLLPVLLSSTLALCLSPAAHAAPPPGQLLASQCFQCHGTNGQPVSGFEGIAGENAAEMYKKLLELSLRRPENIMDLQARAYTPAQLSAIATYLASLPPSGAGESEAP
jgi:cytochrome subunit of sulfide dehydrogenase